MKRFITLSATCRFVGILTFQDKATQKAWVMMAIERYQCCKVLTAAGGIGLS